MTNDAMFARQSPMETSASASADAGDVYEIFVAELEARRERLRQLLRMVTLEANRVARARVGSASHSRCRRQSARTA